MSSEQLEVGAIFDGKYRADAKLGEGGMALVWQVTEVGEVATQHALKLIRLPSFPSEAALLIAKERFRQEAAIQARLRSPHIVGIHRYDVASDGTPYLLMELLEGEDLAAVLRRCGTLPWKTALEVVSQAALALAALHFEGMVHRDLSPGNLFLVRQGEHAPEAAVFVKLLDFGIAKSAQNGVTSLTDPALRIGNPPYMAPECILRKPRAKSASPGGEEPAGECFDARADQFSLATILFEMLAGYRAFLPTGEDPSQAFGMVLNADPLSYDDLPPVFTASLRAVLSRALRKDPVERFATVAEFVSALRKVDPEREVVVPTSVPPPVGTVLTVQMAIWIGLAFIVAILCILAYERDLVAWLSPRKAVLAFPAPPRAALPYQGIPFDMRPGVSDLSVVDVVRIDAGSVKVQDSVGGTPLLGKRTVIPDENVSPVKVIPNKKSPTQEAIKGKHRVSFEYKDSREKDLAAPAIEVFRKVIEDCLSKFAGAHPLIEIRSMKELHASGFSFPNDNAKLSRCLNERMPKGRPLPKLTTVTRTK